MLVHVQVVERESRERARDRRTTGSRRAPTTGRSPPGPARRRGSAARGRSSCGSHIRPFSGKACSSTIAGAAAGVARVQRCESGAHLPVEARRVVRAFTARAGDGRGARRVATRRRRRVLLGHPRRGAGRRRRDVADQSGDEVERQAHQARHEIERPGGEALAEAERSASGREADARDAGDVSSRGSCPALQRQSCQPGARACAADRGCAASPEGAAM